MNNKYMMSLLDESLCRAVLFRPFIPPQFLLLYLPWRKNVTNWTQSDLSPIVLFAVTAAASKFVTFSELSILICLSLDDNESWVK